MWRVYLRWKLRKRNVVSLNLHGPQAVRSMSLVALLTPFARHLLIGLLCVTRSDWLKIAGLVCRLV